MRHAAAPIFQNHCQCRDCQRRSGTGHGSYLTFARARRYDDHRRGEHWRVAGDSGNEKVHAFCPTCGTPVYLTFVAMPDLIAVHAASLDDPALRAAGGHLQRPRAGWDTIDPSLQAFERMPSG